MKIKILSVSNANEIAEIAFKNENRGEFDPYIDPPKPTYEEHDYIFSKCDVDNIYHNSEGNIEIVMLGGAASAVCYYDEEIWNELEKAIEERDETGKYNYRGVQL